MLNKFHLFFLSNITADYLSLLWHLLIFRITISTIIIITAIKSIIISKISLYLLILLLLLQNSSFFTVTLLLQFLLELPILQFLMYGEIIL